MQERPYPAKSRNSAAPNARGIWAKTVSPTRSAGDTVSVDNLHYALARNIAHVIPGLDDETYLRAAKGAAIMWRSEWDKGYRAGRESGLMESTHGGEIAHLRQQLRTAINRACPDRTSHNIETGAH